MGMCSSHLIVSGVTSTCVGADLDGRSCIEGRVAERVGVAQERLDAEHMLARGGLGQAGAHAGQGIAHILAGRRGASLAKRIMSEVEVGLLIRAARPSGIACCLRSSMLEDPASPKRCP
jgi:hypothetical protein